MKKILKSYYFLKMILSQKTILCFLVDFFQGLSISIKILFSIKSLGKIFNHPLIFNLIMFIAKQLEFSFIKFCLKNLKKKFY